MPLIYTHLVVLNKFLKLYCLIINYYNVYEIFVVYIKQITKK